MILIRFVYFLMATCLALAPAHAAYVYIETEDKDDGPGAFMNGDGIASDTKYGRIIMGVICSIKSQTGVMVAINTSAPFTSRDKIAGMISIDGTPRYKLEFSRINSSNELSYVMLSSLEKRRSFVNDLMTAKSSVEIKIDNTYLLFSSQGSAPIIEKLSKRCNEKFQPY